MKILQRILHLFLLLVLSITIFSCTPDSFEIVDQVESDHAIISKSRKIVNNPSLLPIISCANLGNEPGLITDSTPGIKEKSDIYQNRKEIKVKLYFHIVREDDGSGGIDESELDIITQKINDAFRTNLNPNDPNAKPYPNPFKFFRAKRVDYINNSDLLYNEIYFSPTSSIPSETELLTSINNDPEAINIYIVKELFATNGSSNNIQFGGYGFGKRAVISRYFDVYLSNVGAHEVGHCFGLRHTFEQSNQLCLSADPYTTGDRIVDTPLHKNSYTGVEPFSCEFTNPVPMSTNCGEPIPDEDLIFLSKNIMSYTHDSCLQGFTSNQLFEMVLKERSYFTH